MQGERDPLETAARNLLEQARSESNPKRKRKLLEGARRLERWSIEGVPYELQLQGAR